MTPGPQALGCPGCGQSFPPFPPVPGVRYLCLRCDAPLNEVPGAVEQVYAYPAAEPPPGPARLPVARSLGRYPLRAEIGRGGMGVVYRAFDPDLSRDVALKVLLAGQHSTQEHVDRFLREARAAARTEHPNLVRVHDLGWADGLAYFTMELVAGPSLEQVLERRGRLPSGEVARIGAAVARALQAAHARGLVHRDVKPGNVLFRPDGTPLLADFGLATQLGDRRLTRSGQVMGTPAYLAPEQARGESSAASDQYALGAVLYEALGGRSPYAEEVTAAEVLSALAEGPPRPLARVAPGLPPELVVVVETAMARDPARRYPSCRDLAEDLDRWRRGERIHARAPGPWRRAVEALRRRRAAIGLAAAVLGLLLVLARGASTLRGLWERDVLERREVEAERALRAASGEVAAKVAAGDVDGARDLLVELARGPHHAGTSAAARAWIQAADLLTERGRGAEAVDLWAAAWAAARDPIARDDAVRGLEQAFREQWLWASLLRALERHAATIPAAGAEVRTAALRAEAHLGLRQIGEGATDLERARLPGAALARALAGATQVAIDPEARIVDADGDGVQEAWGIRPDGVLVRTRLVPGLPAEELGAIGDGHPLLVVPGDPPLVLLWTSERQELRVLEARGGGLVEVHRATTSVPLDAIRLEDGTVRVALGPYDRDLLRISADGATDDRPSPAIGRAASDVFRLALADLDADGARELLVARGAWTAYDLTAWRGAPDGPGAAPIARRKLGTVEDLRVVPGSPDLVWALHGEAYPSAVVFPAFAPYGEPPGAYLLGLEGGRLATRRFLPAPGPVGRPRAASALVVGDLDGDGADDLAYGVRAGTDALVVHPGSEPGPPLVIGDLAPMAAAQLDDDPALELVAVLRGARPRTTWVLGLGDDPFPPAPALPPLRPAPPGVGEDLLPAWERAEELVGMGLVDAGARELGRLADGARGRAEAVLARRRQAELSADDPERAAALLERAVADGGTDADRVAAAESWLRAHRFESAARVLAPATARSEAARGLLRSFGDELAARRKVVIGSGPLPEGIVVADPLGLTREPDGTLRLATLVGGPDALTSTLDLQGGRLGFGARVDLRRVEWGSGFSIELRGPDGRRIVAWTRAIGGGGTFEREVGCRVGDEEGVTLHQPVSGANEPTVVELDADLSEALGEWRCAVRADDLHASAGGPLAAPLARGPWTWRLGPLASGLETRGQLVARLEGVTVLGSLTPAPPPPEAETLARWFAGEPPAVPPPGHEVQHAAVLADHGRTEEAVLALRSLPEEARAQARVRAAEVLRTRLATFGPVLSEAWGDAWLAAFDEAYATAIHSHHADDEVRLALTTGLPGLEERLPELAGEDRVRAARLVLARGRAWSELGQPGAALRDLQLATEALAPALEGDRSLGVALASAWLDHAVLAVARGDLATAREGIGRARAVARPPELAEDLIAARPELTLLGP